MSGLSSLTRTPAQQVEREKRVIKAHSRSMFKMALDSKREVVGSPITRMPKEIMKKIKGHYTDLLTAKLRDWIDKDKIDIRWLCANTSIHAIKIIEEIIKANPDDPMLDWQRLSKNPSAIGILKGVFARDHKSTKLNWGAISLNSGAYDLIIYKVMNENEISQEDYNGLPSNGRIVWPNISANESTEVLEYLISQYPGIISKYNYHLAGNSNQVAVNHILQGNPANINLGFMSGNSNHEAIKLLIEEIKINPNSPRIDWKKFSGNTSDEALTILEAIFANVPDSPRIDWGTLSGNTNPRAIELIRKKLGVKDKENKDNKISKPNLSANPEAMKILEEYPEYIEWGHFSSNPAIFSLGNLYNTVGAGVGVGVGVGAGAGVGAGVGAKKAPRGAKKAPRRINKTA